MISRWGKVRSRGSNTLELAADLLIVHQQRSGPAAEVPEGILQTTNNSFRGLLANHHAVRLAGAQCHAKGVGTSALPLRHEDGRALPKVQLGLFARR